MEGKGRENRKMEENIGDKMTKEKSSNDE